MKPLLKWAGGKRHIVTELVERFPEGWKSGRYFEPFLGGGAVFLELEPETATIADLNVRLVGFYKHVRENSQAVVEGIQQIAENFEAHSEEKKLEFYVGLRKDFNGMEPQSLESACSLYAINKLCFNGLYRENSKGEFNVPFGHKKMFPMIEASDFDTVSRILKSTIILNCDFEDTVSESESGDFVYFDPPYIPINVTSSFTSYQSSGFNLDDQKRLADLMRNLKKGGVNAMCSNSDTAQTREIFSNLNIQQIQAPRMVSAKSSGRGHITELVITNY